MTPGPVGRHWSHLGGSERRPEGEQQKVKEGKVCVGFRSSELEVKVGMNRRPRDRVWWARGAEEGLEDWTGRVSQRHGFRITHLDLPGL